MDTYKNDLEDENKKLMEIYKLMLNDLSINNKQIEDLKEHLKNETDKFEGMVLLVNCLKYKLDTNTKLLHKIYNNEEIEPINKFMFNSDLVISMKEEKKEEEKPRKKKCICGSENLFWDEQENLHCKDCERI